MRRPRWFIGATAILCALLGTAIAHAAADGVSGKVRVGTQEFALNSVYAVMESDLLAGGDKEKLTVLLTDSPVPPELRKASGDWFFWVEKQARAGAVHGLIITIDPATGVWDRGQLLTTDGLMFYTESTTNPQDKTLNFVADGPIGEHAGGKVRMKAPMQTMEKDESRWKVNADFHCAVILRPTVSATLVGAAALSSPQYKAVLAFLDACRKGNVEAIKAAVDPHSLESMDAMIAGNKQQALKMFAGMAAEATAMKLGKIIVRGDSAEIQLIDPKKPGEVQQSMNVVLVDGAWKIAQ